MRKFVLLAFGTLLVLALGSGCGGAAKKSGESDQDTPAARESRTLTVFAAASLTDAFKELGKKFEAAHPGVTINFNFGASNQLRAQLEQGASADVFASANKKEIDAALGSKLAESADVRLFAWNRLVVLYPKANPAHLGTLQDLAKPKLKLIVADKAVPVGKYTLEMLDKAAADPALGAEFKSAVLANIVSREENVKAVVAKVALGEADAGIAYVSDLSGKDGEKLGRITIADALNLMAEYPLTVLAKSAQKDLAGQFVDFVLSPEGKAVLRAQGFLTEPAGK